MDISSISTNYTVANANKSAEQSNSLQSSLKNSSSDSSEEQLKGVIKDFESYFVEQVIKQMEKMIPESDEDSTASKYMDYFGDTLYQELAEDVTESNNGEGIGIAKTLYEQMKRNYGLE